MGELALQGRDKLTFVVAEPISSFGLWVEQLIAESTGKEGKGILPVADEPLGDARAPTATTACSSTCATPTSPTRTSTPRSRRSRKAGPAGDHAVTRQRRRATSAGSSSSPSSPPRSRAGCWASTRSTSPTCRRPRTTPTKVLRGRRAAAGRRRGRRRAEGAARRGRAAALRGDHGLRAAVARSSTRRSPSCARAIRDATKATTTFGYGPRFLHSTGQLHKGGPPTGLFLQLVHDGDEDVEIPDADYTFGELKNAQADRRPPDAARPRPAGRARAARGRPGARRCER